MKRCKLISCYTDYPIVALGDKPGEHAPMRRVTVLSYDGDKYAKVTVAGEVFSGYEPVWESIKIGYLYSSPTKMEWKYRKWYHKPVNRRKFERMINTYEPGDQDDFSEELA